MLEVSLRIENLSSTEYKLKNTMIYIAVALTTSYKKQQSSTTKYTGTCDLPVEKLSQLKNVLSRKK